MEINKSGGFYLTKLLEYQNKLFLSNSLSLFRYIKNMKSILIAMINTLFMQKAALQSDRRWTQNEIVSLVNNYIQNNGKNENLLNEFLFYLKSETIFLPMEETGLNDFETTYNYNVILCQISIFKTLLERNSVKYLNANTNFLEKVKEAGIEIHEEIKYSSKYTLSESYNENYVQDIPAKESKIDSRVVFDELYYSEVDSNFLEKFLTHLHDFDQDMQTSLYNKMETVYLKTYDPEILKAISAYYNAQQESEDLSGKIRVFLRGMVSAENPLEEQKKFAYSIDPLIKEAFSYETNINSIQEARTYLYSFGMKARMLPTVEECGDNLFDDNENIQLEYAQYLALMTINAEDALEAVIYRLKCIFGQNYYDWAASVGYENNGQKLAKYKGKASLQNALLDTLGYINNNEKEAFLLMAYALSSTDYMVKEHARDALIIAGCSYLTFIKQSFEKMKEDYGRDKMLEVLQTFSKCSTEVISFLESLNSNDRYLQKRIQETITILQAN